MSVSAHASACFQGLGPRHVTAASSARFPATGGCAPNVVCCYQVGPCDVCAHLSGRRAHFDNNDHILYCQTLIMRHMPAAFKMMYSKGTVTIMILLKGGSRRGGGGGVLGVLTLPPFWGNFIKRGKRGTCVHKYATF